MIIMIFGFGFTTV